MGKRELALKYLYKEQRETKISLGRAENRPNVDDTEILNLNAKITAIDWLIPLALAAEEGGAEGVKNAAQKQQRANDDKGY